MKEDKEEEEMRHLVFETERRERGVVLGQGFTVLAFGSGGKSDAMPIRFQFY